MNLIAFNSIRIILSLTLVIVSGCSNREQVKLEVNRIADEFLDAYFIRYPEKATYFGVNKYGHNKLTNHNLNAYDTWHILEDKFLQRLNKMVVLQ